MMHGSNDELRAYSEPDMPVDVPVPSRADVPSRAITPSREQMAVAVGVPTAECGGQRIDAERAQRRPGCDPEEW